MTSTTTTRYEVRYVGAPYGIGETGEMVSRHRTQEAAIEARRKLQSNPRYYGSNSRVVRVEGNKVERVEA